MIKVSEQMEGEKSSQRRWVIVNLKRTILTREIKANSVTFLKKKRYSNEIIDCRFTGEDIDSVSIISRNCLIKLLKLASERGTEQKGL